MSCYLETIEPLILPLNAGGFNRPGMDRAPRKWTKPCRPIICLSGGRTDERAAWSYAVPQQYTLLVVAIVSPFHVTRGSRRPLLAPPCFSTPFIISVSHFTR